MLLFDTCSLLWLVGDQKRFSKPVLDEITASKTAIFVSAISALEIAIKHRQGKLKLPLEPAEWFQQALSFHGLKELSVTSSIAISSAMLPVLHNDPFDRIIVATAKQHQLRILTPDFGITQYPEVSTIF